MPIKIFYLDDEISLLEMFFDTFSSEDHLITTFYDPQTAIEAVKQTPPDIFFIDYRLPKITGDQIAHLLDPKIPKALITGDLLVKTTYNFIGVFEKPYKVAQIEDLLQKIKSQQR